MLKVLGIVLLILAATVGGSAVRIIEFFKSPNILPLPKAAERKAERRAVKTSNSDNTLAVSEEQEEEESPIESVRGTVNVLVVGLDNVDGGSRTDAIALAIFDADNSAVRIASIPRDSRVYIPGRGWDKINHAYVYGGINLLRETVVNLTGVPVDYFVKVNYKSFPRIIDLIGGVDIYVDKRMNYTDYSGKLFINIPKGQQHMNGKTALGYVRFRHDPLGDIGRVQRQQKFINIVINKFKSPSIIPKIPSLIQEMMKAVDTDLSPLDALRLLQFANALGKDRITMFMAPGRAGYSKNISYWILDNVKFSMQLAAKLPPPSEPVALMPASAMAEAQEQTQNNNNSNSNNNTGSKPQSSNLDSDKIAELCAQVGQIRILNGDGEKGISKRAAQIFQRVGIEVPYTGNARHFDYHATNIIYPPSGDDSVREGAYALAELCGITNRSLIKEDRRAVSISLILGHDKKQIFERLNKLNF
ncbi:MAG: LCP family protein [Synergistaceae bacterium]|nr:LCP family protein [Synergistaceae bacterium]